MRCWILLIAFALSSLVPARAQRRDCEVDAYEDYYGKKLDEDYGFRRVSDKVAEALYEGPLQRSGDPDGLANLKALFTRDREMTIRRIQEIVKDHLYGESDEFRDFIADLTEKYGAREASHRILDSIYRIFRYRPDSPAEEDFDACLIRNRQAHLVVTKTLIRMRGVKD